MAASELDPGVAESGHEFFKSSFLDHYSLIGLGCKPCCFSKFIVLGAHLSSVCVIKVGMPNVGLEPFAPQENFLDFGFFPGNGSLCREWDFIARLSQSLSCFNVVFLFT